MYSEILLYRMKYAREKKGITQSYIADRLNISQSTYANYEKGRRIPDIEKIGKFADLLGLSVDWLIGKETPKSLEQ